MANIGEAEFDAAISYSLLQRDMANWKAEQEAEHISNAIDPELVELKKERSIRARLNSADGNVVDIYDQFYRDHKLLLILFRALAVMPITRSEPGRITFSWSSSATIYAIFFYIMMTVIVLIVGFERIKILQTTKRFDEYIYAIIFVVFLVPHFWIPFVGWGVANHVAVYKTMWGTFQCRYYRVTGSMLQFPKLKIQIVIISVGCLLCAIAFLLALSFLFDGFSLWHTSAYYHIMTMINMNCALWYINCRAIRISSNSLSDCFRKDVGVQCSSALISQYRYLWLNLSELLQTLGNAYARTYSTYCLFMFVNITIGCYGALSEIFDHGIGYSFKEMGLFVDTIYCASLLFIFCDCSHNATLQVAQGVQDTLLSINMLAIDRQTQREQITTIAIYLIVLLQFKLSLVTPEPAATIAD